MQLIIGSLSISFLVLTTKLEKVKLSDEDWKIFLDEIGQANSNSVLSVLHLSDCWPSDETLEVQILNFESSLDKVDGQN